MQKSNALLLGFMCQTDQSTPINLADWLFADWKWKQISTCYCCLWKSGNYSCLFEIKRFILIYSAQIYSGCRQMWSRSNRDYMTQIYLFKQTDKGSFNQISRLQWQVIFGNNQISNPDSVNRWLLQQQSNMTDPNLSKFNG